MSIITTIPHVGQRVVANTVPGAEEYNGSICTVTATGRPGFPLQGEFQSRSKPDDTMSFSFADWTPVGNPKVNEGDTVRALAVPAIPHAEGRICTVVRGADRDGASNIWCTFEEYVDGDGIPREETQWYVHEWEQVFDTDPEDEPITFETRDRMIGKTVKVIYASNNREMVGMVGTVTETYPIKETRRYADEKVDGITVRIDDRFDWVQAYEVIDVPSEPAVPAYVPQEGDRVIAWEPNVPLGNGSGPYPGVFHHTRYGNHWVSGDFNRSGIFFSRVEKDDAHEYVPSVGDRVVITGHLADDGIHDGYSVVGSVRAVTGLIWEVWSETLGHVVSGPGYVAKAPQIVEAGPTTEPEVVIEVAETEEQRRIKFLEEQNRILMKSVDDWTHDFDTLAEEVKDESIQRDWCEEYERVMGGVQAKLRVGTIPERTKPRVQVLRRVRASVYRDVRVWVEEGDEYTTDTDEMYEEQDSEYSVGDEWANDVIVAEYDNNGFDDIEVDSL